MAATGLIHRVDPSRGRVDAGSISGGWIDLRPVGLIQAGGRFVFRDESRMNTNARVLYTIYWRKARQW
eukprot:1246655-Prymnesium_polylepis.2